MRCRETCRYMSRRHARKSQDADFLQHPKIHGVGTHPAVLTVEKCALEPGVPGRRLEREAENMRRTSIPAGLALCLLVLPTVTHAEPAQLGGTGFTLYEVSERVHMDPSTGEAVRVSPLLGFAELGTPNCRAAVGVTFAQLRLARVVLAADRPGRAAVTSHGND